MSLSEIILAMYGIAALIVIVAIGLGVFFYAIYDVIKKVGRIRNGN